MEIGTRVVPKYDKISPHVGTVIDNENGLTVKWDNTGEIVRYTVVQVREIREGELEMRIEAERKLVEHKEKLRKD